MRILLLSDERIRLEGTAGPLSIEADSPETSYSPFHMMASALSTCVLSVLHSWAQHANLSADDLQIEVGWEFADEPRRVGSYEMVLIWPSLPENRRAAAERATHLCPVHQTLQNPPQIRTRIDGTGSPSPDEHHHHHHPHHHHDHG